MNLAGRPVGRQHKAGTVEIANRKADHRLIVLRLDDAVRPDAGDAAGRAGEIDVAIERGALAGRSGEGETLALLDVQDILAGITDPPDLGARAIAQNYQIDIAGALAVQAETGHTVGWRSLGQWQVENANAVGDDSIAQDGVGVGGGPEDQRQVFAAQLKAGRCRQAREPHTGMAGAKLAIGIVQVEPALTRRGDNQAERGGVGIGQEGEGRRAALGPDKGRGDKDFAIAGLDRGGLLDGLLWRRATRGQCAERRRYKERSPQGPRTAKVRPG